MKVATINIRIVNIKDPDPLSPATDGDGGKRDADATTATNGDTTFTDPVLIQGVESPAPYPVNDEAFRVVVA